MIQILDRFFSEIPLERGSSLDQFAMSNLAGLAKLWFADDGIKSRVQKEGIGSLVVVAGGKPIVTKDQTHALTNKEVLIPIMQSMRQQHLIKTPHMKYIENEVHTLYLLSKDEDFDVQGKLPPIDDVLEIPIHLVVTNIKKLVCFVRSKRLRNHTPRDRVYKYNWQCLLLRLFPIMTNDQKKIGRTAFQDKFIFFMFII